MATIFIKGRTDPIIVSNERARTVKNNWCGDSPVDKNVILDLGEWAGEYGQIKSIELEKVKIYQSPVEENLSDEQWERAKKIRKETRNWLEQKGIINKRLPNV